MSERAAGTPYFILYVRDQARSSEFYAQVLGAAPRLQVPGMTEFDLPGGAVLGLMPEAGIVGLLGKAIADPRLAQGIPRCELYLLVPAALPFARRAEAAGAKPVAPFARRAWGHSAAYFADPDDHVLAFAEVS